jgi:hypothetical protein
MIDAPLTSLIGDGLRYLALRNREREDDALDYLGDCSALYRHWDALIKVNHVKGNVIPQSIYKLDNG